MSSHFDVKIDLKKLDKLFVCAVTCCVNLFCGKSIKLTN